MKNENEHGRLMDDILEEIAPPAFRAELLDRILKQAQRRNRMRRWNNGVFTTAVIAVIGLFAWRMHVPEKGKQEQPLSGLTVVTSKPLAASMAVESNPGSVTVISSFPSTITVVETSPSAHDYRELNDEELLAMVAGTPSVLVRLGPHQAELLVVDASTHAALPVEELPEQSMLPGN